MRKLNLMAGLCATFGALLTGATTARADAAATDGLKDWLAKPRDQRPELKSQPFATAKLTKDQAAAADKMLWDDWVAMVKETRQKEWDDKEITVNGVTLKLKERHYGQKPEKGWNFFISMHGGGTDPTGQTNDSQWENQIRLKYETDDSLVIAPRAPTDTWDMWFQKPIDGLFERLIEDAIVLGDVDPNRVYLMGYSAGGDGVYRMGPRMADSWAAASMMAGHPGDVSALSLRNIGFTIHVGGKDAAFKRNEKAVEFKNKLDALQKDDPKGYKHEVQVHENKGHWMDMEDKVAIDWMKDFTRNPTPDKVVWMQGDRPHDNFYWLATPAADAKKGQLVVVTRVGQKFNIEKSTGVKSLTVMFNDTMVDLDQPITLSIDGKEVYNGPETRSIAELSKTIARRGDPYLAFSAEHTILLDQ